MYVGQVIGNGNKAHRRLDLLCTVEEIIPGGIKFYVINGNWYGTLVANKLTCVTPSGNTTHDAAIRYTGHIPRRSSWEYQDTMDFINARLNGYVPLVWYNVVSYFNLRISRFTNAVGAGVKAFKYAWDPKKTRATSDYEDDIAF